MSERTDKFMHLAPCGLDCSRCAEFKAGEIAQTSARLLELLGNYSRLATIKATSNPVFNDYQSFEVILSKMAAPSCGGCRQPDANCPVNCQIRGCRLEKQVDFCFTCQDYPCATGLQGFIGERWRANNDRMQELGLEGYDKEQRKHPRYR